MRQLTLPVELISVVVPTYNVARYLPDFLAGLDAQRGGLDDVEVVFVDDGSSDESAQLIRAWIDAVPGRSARLISKSNGGLSSARNAGLEQASGDWVTFCDPDDVLTPPYLDVVRGFLRSAEADEVDLVAANLVNLEDESGEAEDSHPLRFRFAQTRVVDLDRQPTYIHLHANTGFYRRARLVESGLRFDERIVPNFEDAHLTALYLGQRAAPRLAFLRDARYHYRRRSDGSSLVQGGWGKPGKYRNVPRYGWLDLLTRLSEAHGRAPIWAQNVVLYDLSLNLRADLRVNTPVIGVPEEWTGELLDWIREVVPHLDTEAVCDYRIKWLAPETKLALLRMAGRDPLDGVAHLDRLDESRKLVRLRYFFTRDRPVERFRSRGEEIRPVFGKVRSVRIFGRTVLYERTAWLPSDGNLNLDLDGRPIALVSGRVQLPRYALGPTAIRAGLTAGPLAEETVDPPATVPVAKRARAVAGQLRRTAREWRRRDRAGNTEVVSDAAVRALARSPYARARYRNAWVLMDRDDQAQDNAEHLYRYLRAHQPSVNAFFALAESSPDWPRLQAEGFRLLAHGSREHTVALLNAVHLISSQVDRYVVEPLDPERFGPMGARFTFLQHGVTKDDLSHWINPKPISLLITATEDEHESFVGDGTPYVFCDKETALTGFPRHDRLLELAAGGGAGERPVLLVMPTWRRDLVADRVSGGNERGMLADFWSTDYARAWRGLLESERLRAVCATQGWDLAFVPHPNMAGYVDSSPLPGHVQVYRFSDVDIQALVARCAVLVTDYSSMAFEAAYLERPCVYYQFDRESFFDGRHAYRRGTWSYPESGFGPITEDPEATLTAVEELAARDGKPAPRYADRMQAAFPHRDGQCCRRVYEAIVAMDTPMSVEQRYLPAGSP